VNTSLAFPLPSATDFIDRLEKRMLRDIQDVANEWSHCTVALTQWERQNLLDDPTDDLLRQHKVLTNNLLHLGKLLRAATAEPEFPDKALAEMVVAGVHILEDKLLMWHSPLGKEEADQVLREVGLL
jgi:hypothetical protein